MYELLAGKPPFTGDANMAVMAQHLNNTAPRLDRINSSITPQLAAIVATCLARNPNDRYKDMTALIEAIDHPENVDLSILDKEESSSRSLMPLIQAQTIRGIFIAIAIIGELGLDPVGLQHPPPL